MIGALWTGISGLAGQQTALDNESHNISNVNTVGYKASRISFADQMYQNSIGKGTQILNAEKMYTQGNLKITGVNYDMALSGDGFFTVQTSGVGTNETYYTRAGNFRMGDPGRLQDALGNNVIGWAARSDQETVSSDPNKTKFTSDYTKLLSSKIITHPTAIETITAKSTDYNVTSGSDNSSVYTGSGLKSKYSKISDIEELIKNYNTRLTSHQEDPSQASINAIAQTSRINLSAYGSVDAVSQSGDEVFVFIDGNKVSQQYIISGALDRNNDGDVLDAGESAAERSYENTMKAFADEISKVAGLKAYTVSDVSGSAVNSTSSTAAKNGTIRIKSLIPGKSFTISSTGMVHGGTNKPGVINTDIEAIEGQGISALESASDALNRAISGKQRDVYKASDFTFGRDVKYDLTVYDKASKEIVTLTPSLTIASPANIDAIVTAINSSTSPLYSDYIEAKNINGNLVVSTLDTNFEVEYTGTFTGATSEEQTIAVTGTATGAVTFLGSVVNNSAAADTPAQTVSKIIADKASIIAAWNTANPTLELEDIKGSDANLTLVYKKSEGNVATVAGATSAGITFAASVESITGGTITSTVKRDSTYSGREGAGAEFLEMKTYIDQTATKNPIQLRLDTLGISDSAFGEFAVDDSGIITMSQDGAVFAVGQVAIAKFITNRALEPVGNNLLRSNSSSGDPIYNLNNNKTATVESSTLELSTADLSESLVNLMVFQRAFEANSKSITTADTILNTLIQLKR
jgi:flagellar hook protein FlgE